MTWAARAASSPRGFWALDATPWAIDADGIADDVVRVIAQVRSMRPPFSNHEQVRGAFLQAGFSEMLAGWMTTNVERAPDGLRWRFDLDVVDALLRDYARVDLMDSLRLGEVKVDIVRAGRSDRWDPPRLAELEDIASTSDGRVSIHLLADAGHWVHVDDPEGTLRLLVTALEQMDHEVIDS
jgi:pimeloyl-ACP methyl ester carboxylesterase